MNKGIVIKILLGILIIVIMTILIGFIKTQRNNRDSNKGKILYEDNVSNFLMIINFVLIGVIVTQVMMSLKGNQYGGIVATVTLAIVNLTSRPTKFIITEQGIGVADQFNGFLQFIWWDNLKKCSWSKYDGNILYIDGVAKGGCIFKEFKIRTDEIKKVDGILNKYYKYKQENNVMV